VANVLIWGDDPKLAEILGQQGHKIFSFTDQDAALDCAVSRKLALALVAADTPAGLELLHRLRRLHPNLRLITLTGSPSLPLLRQAMSLGVQEILFTPLDPEELADKVARVIKVAKHNLKEALALP
jgi:DNA-binding NtrC family response regulator